MWNAPEILSSDRDGAQASIISPRGWRCSSSHEISRRKRRNPDGIRVKCLVIVEEHPRNERCFRAGRSISLPPIECGPVLAIAQQSPDCAVCLRVSSSDSDSELDQISSSSSSSSPPHSTSCTVNETRFLNGMINANSSSISWNRKPSKASPSIDEPYASKKGAGDTRESRKSIPRNSRWCRFFSLGQVKSDGNGSAPETWSPKTVSGPSEFWERISDHRLRQEKRNWLVRDCGDFGAGPDSASADSRVHARIRLAQIPITGHRP